jgi:hypothetical protein
MLTEPDRLIWRASVVCLVTSRFPIWLLHQSGHVCSLLCRARWLRAMMFMPWNPAIDFQ